MVSRRALLQSGALLAPSLLRAAGLAAAIRPDHPRLFFNAESWPAVKARALGRDAALFAAMRARVDELPAQPADDRDYGTEAAEAAFVYRVTGEPRYRRRATQLLAHSAALYVRRYAQKRAVHWYSFTRINAIAAFDWLHNELSPAQRRAIGRDLLAAVRDAQPTRARKAFATGFSGVERENWGNTTTGFYSTPSLLWFAGLALLGEGIDDPLAEQFLRRGHQLQLEVLRHRAAAAGDDGGSASATLGYWLGAYPWAEFNFFHTWQSATGADISADWPYVAALPNYIFWNWLPGMREFGAGDARHTTNEIPAGDLRTHLAQIVHFYGKRMPASAAAAQWLAERAPARESRVFPWTRFLLDDPPPAPPADIAAALPLARHFENMGQIFFRSGSGPDDTYALFAAGGTVSQHRHYDNNHFGIFKKGFLALDTGTRPQPGQHLSHYYCRTVAHNSILIRMPGERMPSYWGSNPGTGEEKLPYPNDGGQCKVLGSTVVAFETRPEYAYAASDTTAAYHPDKCRLALRQFVFIAPDWFVVFDRVISTDPSYPKTWLLHTAAEPALSGDTFTAAHEQGRLFCRTLLPEPAAIGKIGGPGKQFWSDGRNWPIPPDWPVDPNTPLLGQWRVEVSPRTPAREDFFLHFIHAGDARLARMAPSRLLRDETHAGVRFETPAGAWEVWFAIAGSPSGRIRLERGGREVLHRPLARDVAPQSGFLRG